MAFQTNHYKWNLYEISWHPVNMGLVPIHDKNFVRNLTLHHFLLSPDAWNIRVSIILSDIITKTITKSHHFFLSVYTSKV